MKLEKELLIKKKQSHENKEKNEDDRYPQYETLSEKYNRVVNRLPF